MSHVTTYIDCCEVQANLMESWNYNNLGHDGAPGLKFVLSPINRLGFIQGAMNMKPNGLRDVQVIFQQRLLESDVEDSGQISCDATAEDGETSQTYTLDPSVGASVSWKVTPANLRGRCQANPLWYAQQIKRRMDALIEKADTDYLTQIVANTGNFASDVDAGDPAGTTSVVVTQSRNADDVLVEKALQDVRHHFMNNGFSSVPFGFGTKLWSDYSISKKAACCSQLGVDVATYDQISSFGFEFSHKMAGLLGNSTDAIFLAPNVTQMIWFNEFTGPDGSIDNFNDGHLIQGVLAYPDANLPLKFDYRAEYVCEGTTRYWKVSLAIAYDFIFLPTDLYHPGDRKEGVNGVNQFRITNP